MALVRIYDNTEQTTPEDGYSIAISKSGAGADKRLVLSKFFTYEEKVQIGTWNMQGTPLFPKVLTNIATVDRIDKLIIIDDDGLEYDGNALYDSWIHQAKRQVGIQASKTVSITGSTDAVSPGSVDEAVGATSRRLIFAGKIVGNVLTETYRDPVTLPLVPTLATYDSGGIRGYTITHNLNRSDYHVFFNHERSDLSWANIAPSLNNPQANSFQIFFLRGDNVTVSDANCYFEMYEEAAAQRSHTHGIAQTHSHSVTGSGSTGSIVPESGFAFKCAQVISYLDRPNSTVYLTHNIADSYNEIMTGFGLFQAAHASTVLQKFKSTLVNRGYIIIKRKFLVP